MAVINNIFDIEDSIATRLEIVTGINEIFRGAVADGLNEETSKPTSLIIRSRGLLAGDHASKVSSQKITTLWEIELVFKKEEYKTSGGTKILEVIRALNGFKADNWISEARLAKEERKNNEPLYGGALVYYPLLFAVEIIT